MDHSEDTIAVGADFLIEKSRPQEILVVRRDGRCIGLGGKGIVQEARDGAARHGADRTAAVFGRVAENLGGTWQPLYAPGSPGFQARFAA